MSKQKGFSLVEILLIFLILAIIGAGGWYVLSKNKDSSTDKTPTDTGQKQDNSEPQPAQKPAPAPAEPDPTADWASYTDETFGYTLKYPTDWVTADNPELCVEGSFMTAPSADSVGRCASESGGQVSISAREGGYEGGNDYTASYYTDRTEEEVVVSGVAATKISATVMGMEDEVEIGAQEDGTTVVQYLITKDGVTYIALYTQRSSYTDELDTFTTIVEDTLEL